jgi:hypothetical protein
MKRYLQPIEHCFAVGWLARPVFREPIGRYFDFYNRKRPHSSPDRRTPDQAYFEHLPHVAAA